MSAAPGEGLSSPLDRMAQGEAIKGEEIYQVVDEKIDEIKAEADKVLNSEVAGEVQKRAGIAFEETKQYMESEEGLQKIEHAKKKAEDLALKALGEDVVQQAKTQMDRIESFISSDEASEFKASIMKMSDEEIPDHVKDKIINRTGQMWDKLSQDDKTRELAATMVNALNSSTDSMELKELKEKFFGACGDKENVEKMLGEVQSLVTKLASDEEAQQELMQDGSKVWEKIEGNDEVWSLLREGKDVLAGLDVGADEKLLENAQVQALKAKGEVILGDLVQSEETQRLIEKTKLMCGSIWEQLQADIGITGKIDDFLSSGQEIWDKIDGDTLKAAVGTLLKGLLELVLEFVPSLELPRVNGFYSSPVGEVCYQIAGMQFSTFAFSPEGVQIMIDKKLTVQLDDISAEVNDFCWQFAKSSWPFVTGEGVASVSVRQASVFLEYSLTYTGGQVMIVIEAQSIDMKEFEVHVAEATAGWLYNMILSVLNNRLRRLLESKLLELAVTKLADLSTTVNDLSQGFLNISMSEELKTKVNEDNQQEHEDEERALRVLMDAFHSSSKLGKEIFTVDSLSVAPFLASLPGVPKVLLFSSHDTIPPLYEQLFRMFHEALLFGLVPAGNGKKLQKEYNVEQVPCLKVVTKETKPITFEGNISQEELTTFLQHFCVSFGKVSPISNFSMDFFLQHAPPDSSIVLLFTERDDLPPLYTELAKNFRMFLFAIIRHTETDMVEKFQITKYPALMVMPRPDKPPIAYRGDIVPKDVHNFLSNFAIDMNNIVRINTYTIDVFLDREKHKPHVILFTSHDTVPRLYEDLWRKFHFYMCFAIIIAPEEELKTRFSVTECPRLLTSTDGEIVYFEEEISAKGVFEFLSTFASAQRSR